MKIRPETLLEAQEIASSITRYIQVFLDSSDDEKQIHSVVDLTKDELDERILWSMEAPESDYEKAHSKALKEQDFFRAKVVADTLNVLVNCRL
ncbi:MAG: hypothetical protein HRT61_06825 [Ekhidna sp.]|nr:hypothetical protein [Ekhidna sp.]